jgi:hypothetical protein
MIKMGIKNVLADVLIDVMKMGNMYAPMDLPAVKTYLSVNLGLID